MATQAARCGVRHHAGLKAADGDHLVLRPNSDGEGAGAAAQDLVGAIIEWLKGWNRRTQTRWAESSSAGSSLGRSVLELCLGKEGAETCKVLGKFLIISSTENSSFCKNLFGKTILCTENCLSQGKTSVFPRLCSESEEYKG